MLDRGRMRPSGGGLQRPFACDWAEIIKVVLTDRRQLDVHALVHIEVFLRRVQGNVRPVISNRHEERRFRLMRLQLPDRPVGDLPVAHRVVRHVQCRPIERFTLGIIGAAVAGHSVER